MIRKYLFILSAMILCSCTTQKQTTIKNNDIEIFNIAKFNNQKDEFNQYILKSEDMELFQLWDDYYKEYNEFITIYNQHLLK